MLDINDNARSHESALRLDPSYATPAANLQMLEFKAVANRIKDYLNATKLKELQQAKPTGTNPTGATNPTSAPSLGGARVVNIQVGDNTYPVNTDAQSAANLVNAFKQSARSAGR
jgi:hypothetical protein